MTTDSEMIDELTTLEAAATPLPWTATEFQPGQSATWATDGEPPEPACVYAGSDDDDFDPDSVLLYQSGFQEDKVCEANLRLSAAARNALPSLLALARRSVEHDAAIRVAGFDPATVQDWPDVVRQICVERAEAQSRAVAAEAENARLREAGLTLLRISLPPHDVSGARMWNEAASVFRPSEPYGS